MSISGNEINNLYTELKSLLELKKRYKSLNVAIHEIATKLAQKYLEKMHPEIKDWHSKPRAGTGIDIFGPNLVEPKVVAEVTAHEPIRKTRKGSPRFGAQQRQRIHETINKLLQEKNSKKYLFLISKNARTAVMQEFETLDIQVVNLLEIFVA